MKKYILKDNKRIPIVDIESDEFINLGGVYYNTRQEYIIMPREHKKGKVNE